MMFSGIKRNNPLKKWAEKVNRHFSKEAHKNMFNIANQYRKQIKVTMRYHFILDRMAIIKKVANKCWRGLERREPFYTVRGNVNWYSHYGEQYRGSSRNKKQSYHMTLQSHSWAYIQRKMRSKRIHAPQWSLQHCLQQLRHRSNLNVH